MSQQPSSRLQHLRGKYRNKLRRIRQCPHPKKALESAMKEPLVPQEHLGRIWIFRMLTAQSEQAATPTQKPLCSINTITRSWSCAKVSKNRGSGILINYFSRWNTNGAVWAQWKRYGISRSRLVWQCPAALAKSSWCTWCCRSVW